MSCQENTLKSQKKKLFWPLNLLPGLTHMVTIRVRDPPALSLLFKSRGGLVNDICRPLQFTSQNMRFELPRRHCFSAEYNMLFLAPRHVQSSVKLRLGLPYI